MISRRGAGTQRMTQKKPWTLDLVGFDTRLMAKPRDVLMALKNDVLCVSAPLREKMLGDSSKSMPMSLFFAAVVMEEYYRSCCKEAMNYE